MLVDNFNNDYDNKIHVNKDQSFQKTQHKFCSRNPASLDRVSHKSGDCLLEQGSKTHLIIQQRDSKTRQRQTMHKKLERKENERYGDDNYK